MARRGCSTSTARSSAGSEIDSLRLPDRLTIAVGATYINVRERADAPTYNGYEHFGVAFDPPTSCRRVWDAASATTRDVTVEPISEIPDGFLSFRLRYLFRSRSKCSTSRRPARERSRPRRRAAVCRSRGTIPGATDPVGALAAARAELGDTFEIVSGRDRYLFVFSPDALRAFYALPEHDASKGLADYRMLVRKLPEELFAGVRTMAHDLFGAQDVETYLAHLDHALDLELGDARARRARSTRSRSRAASATGSASRAGSATAPRSRRGSIASSPSSTSSTAPTRSYIPARMQRSRRPTSAPNAPHSRASRSPSVSCWPIRDRDRSGFLDEIARRWSDTDEPRAHAGHRARRRAAAHRDDDEPVRRARLDARAARAAPRRARPRRGGRPPAARTVRARVDPHRPVLGDAAHGDATRSRSTTARTRYTLAPGVDARDDARAHQHHRRARPRRATTPTAGTAAACATKPTCRPGRPSRRSATARTAVRRSGSRSPRSRARSAGS